MKKAFTLLELVFVIVIVAIISATMIPDNRDTNLRQAATQLVSHIRYTQHLAMVDDKFDMNDLPNTATTIANSKWYKSRWQIRFTNGVATADSFGLPGYAIWSDTIGEKTGAPDANEIALDPLSGQMITGGITASVLLTDNNVYHKASLGETYGITNIALGPNCRVAVNSSRISFDHLGRPLIGAMQGYNSAYPIGNLMINICNITLTDPSGNITIQIEPETGYTHL